MKKLYGVVSIILTLLSTSVLAETLLPDNDCADKGFLAEVFMDGRQNEALLSEVIASINESYDNGELTFKESKWSISLALMAYEEPVSIGSEEQTRAKKMFRNKIELECYMELSK